MESKPIIVCSETFVIRTLTQNVGKSYAILNCRKSNANLEHTEILRALKRTEILLALKNLRKS